MIETKSVIIRQINNYHNLNSYNEVLSLNSAFGWEIDKEHNVNNVVMFKRDTNMKFYNDIKELELSYNKVRNNIYIFDSKLICYPFGFLILISMIVIPFLGFCGLLNYFIFGWHKSLITYIIPFLFCLYYLYKRSKDKKRLREKIAICNKLLVEIVEEVKKITNIDSK